MGPTDAAAEREVLHPLQQGGSNVVESAAILLDFVAAPHERCAELAKRMHDTEHVGDDTA
ncbi:MAG: hypothetical protein ACRDN9_17735 [Streptosporangiaceae bacterium]